MRKKARPLADVVNLAEVRAVRRLSLYHARIRRVLESNRRAIGRLYTSGALFTPQGIRAGRDLLLAHQHLLRVVTLLERLTEAGDVPPPRHPAQIHGLFAELDQLLARTQALTHRTGEYLERLRGD